MNIREALAVFEPRAMICYGSVPESRMVGPKVAWSNWGGKQRAYPSAVPGG